LLRPVYRLQLFAPVPPIETGLAVPSDATTLAMLDLDGDGWLYFLISRNGEATLAFHNRGVAGRHCLCVTLQAKAGNPQAVEARAKWPSETTMTSPEWAGRVPTTFRLVEPEH
jgi:hypothetical protein